MSRIVITASIIMVAIVVFGHVRVAGGASFGGEEKFCSAKTRPADSSWAHGGSTLACTTAIADVWGGGRAYELRA